jgi:hypothetical protein
MGYGKKACLMMVVLSGSFLVGGCATASRGKPASAYEQGYRQGVAENMGGLVEKLNGNTFPYMNGTWAQPLVQEVRMPAHVAGGVFYPEHNELVLITPGEWKKSGAFPISEKAKKIGENGPVIERNKIYGQDITVMPLTTEGFQRGEE